MIVTIITNDMVLIRQGGVKRVFSRGNGLTIVLQDTEELVTIPNDVIHEYSIDQDKETAK